MVARVRPSQTLSDLLVEALKKTEIRVHFGAFIHVGRRIRRAAGKELPSSEKEAQRG